MAENRNLLDDWEVSRDDLAEILALNPSLRGMVFGYVAELKLRKLHLNDRRITGLVKYDDHDRSRKSDLVLTYRDNEIRIEVKSLQTNKVRHEGAAHSSTFQCDASDRRTVALPDGSTIQTTCLLIGEFDVLAVNLFAFGEGWQFAYALNDKLPRAANPYLLASSMRITWPVIDPYSLDPFPLFEQVVERRRAAATESASSMPEPVVVKQDDAPAEVIQPSPAKLHHS